MSQTVRRALSVLEFIGEAPRTLTEVTEFLELHKSTALRLLQTLEEAGFARQRADGKYSIGFSLVTIAQNTLDGIEIHGVAKPHLTRLSERYGHTVHLAQLVDDHVIYVDKLDGQGAVKMQSRVGRSAELHTAGIAKVILAYTDEETRQRMLHRVTYRRYTATTITLPAAFHRELELIKERGWAEDDGEYEDYIGCIAAPIRDFRGGVIGGVSLTALRSLADKEELRSYVPDLLSTANAVSRDLGWKGPNKLAL